MPTTQYLTFIIQKCQQAAKEVSLVKWENWEDAMGLPDGWKVREYLNFCDSQRRSKLCNLILNADLLGGLELKLKQNVL